MIKFFSVDNEFVSDMATNNSYAYLGPLYPAIQVFKS